MATAHPVNQWASAAVTRPLSETLSVRLRPVLALLACVVLGFLAIVGISTLGFQVPELGMFGVALLLLMAIPTCVILMFGLREALRRFSKLWRSLRWWHGLWLVLLISGFVFRTRDVGSVRENPADAAAIFRISLVGFTAFILVTLLALRRLQWLGSLFQGLVGAMTMYALFCVVSTLWSVNAPWTLYKSLEYLIDVALLAAILNIVKSVELYETLLDWTWTLCGLLVASAWIEAALWPQEAMEGQWVGGLLKLRLTGLYPGQGSNGLGTFGAILAVIAVARLLSNRSRSPDRVWYGLILVGGIVTMIFSQTRSAIVGFLLGLLLILFFAQRLPRSVVVGLGVMLALALIGFGPLIWAFLQRGQSAEQMMSLTGRVNWWVPALELFRQHPLTGLGAYAAGPFAVSARLGNSDVGPLHSDYVESAVGTGIWGPAAILIAVFGSWWVLARYLRDSKSDSLERQLAVESFAVLAIVTLRSVVMNLIVFHPPLQFFVVLGYAEFLRRKRNYRLSAANASIGSWRADAGSHSTALA